MSGWIKEQIETAGAEGAVVGLSGGVDSAVTAGLCARVYPDRTVAVLMPCHSDPKDLKDAGAVAEAFDLPAVRVRLDDLYDRFLSTAAGPVDSLDFSHLGEAGDERLAEANVKPRLRMMTLYYVANRLNFLVVGTGNGAELMLGYFTKYGDGGVDLLPLGRLTKRGVYRLAEDLGTPRAVIERPPSAGLWTGQEDEKELGLRYEEIDRHLQGAKIDPEVRQRIERLEAASAHKRRMPALGPEPAS